jgi:hypothetical protein
VHVVGLPEDAIALAPGGNHTCVITDDNGVKCWGDAFYGAIGNAGVDEREQLTPVDVDGLAGIFTSAPSPTPLPDVDWGDFNCSGAYNESDGAYMLAWWAGVGGFEAAGLSECPAPSSHPQINGATGIWADTDCSAQVDLNDILDLFRDLAGFQLAGLPGFCPELGEPVQLG